MFTKYTRTFQFSEHPRKQLASGGAEAAGVRTPPPNPLIFNAFVFALSKIYQCSVFRSIEGASRGTPGGGSPTLRAAPPPPPKAPQRGVIGPPKGRGRAAPLSALRAPLRPPWGTPAGFPRPLGGSPSRFCSAMERDGQAKRAGAAAPEKGLEKNQSGGADRGRQAASGGNVGKARKSVGRGGGSRWAAPRAVHGVSLPLSTDRRSRSPVAQRSPHLHRRGSNSAPSGGLLSGLRQRVQPEKCPVVLARQR